MGSSNEKYPEFFKVFLPDHCSENLRIPDAFLNHLSHKFPKKVMLRNSLGKHWPVEVAETGDGLFFQDGWSRLVSDNSLQVGEFMFFKYNGHHIVDIRIFCVNGREKEQVEPSVRAVPIQKEEENMPLEQSEEKEVPENGMMGKDKGHVVSGKRTSVDQVGSSIRKEKLVEPSVRAVPIEQEEENMPLEQSEEEDVVEIGMMGKDKGHVFGKRTSVDQVGSSIRKEKPMQGRGQNYSVSGYCAEKLKKGIEEFLPPNNPFFVTKLRKTRRSELTIPYDIRVDFDLKFSNSIKLQDPKGRSWIGKVVPWKDGRVWVTKGWRPLCNWNKVGEDDTLICEFMPSSKQTCEVIKVQVIRSGTMKD